MSEIIKRLLSQELKRQNSGIELIASENYPSKAVLDACGSIAMDKYAEGYPFKRYYGGCLYIDAIEDYAIEKAKELFKVGYANVQPHSGSQANAAAYQALLPNGGTILSMRLNDGAHLSHGSGVSFSSDLYNFVFFPLGKDGKIDYNVVEKYATEIRPDVILTGYSAYPFKIDFAKFKQIADKVGARLMVDMAHVAGLVAADKYDNPCKYADVVTSTTHKTLRGARGGLILTNDQTLAKKINSAVFPYYQGGPLMNMVAGKAVCFEEALTQEYGFYIEKVLQNTTVSSEVFKQLGAKASDTETHLLLLDTLESYGLTGLEAQQKLEEIHITTNKNMLPGDMLKPSETSGLRIGFAAATTRGCTLIQASVITELIHNYLSGKVDKITADFIRKGIVSEWKDISNL
jgi:glycine hydroxymethyltransferase